MNIKLSCSGGQHLALLCALLLATCSLAIAQVATAPGGSGQQNGAKRMITADLQQQAAPFYSIKDGKTSARRISQQTSFGTNANNWSQSGARQPIKSTQSMDAANANAANANSATNTPQPQTLMMSVDSRSQNPDQNQVKIGDQSTNGRFSTGDDSSQPTSNGDELEQQQRDNQQRQSADEMARSKPTGGDEMTGNDELSQQQISAFNQLLANMEESLIQSGGSSASSAPTTSGSIGSGANSPMTTTSQSTSSSSSTATSAAGNNDSMSPTQTSASQADNSIQLATTTAETPKQLVMQPLSQQQEQQMQFTTSTGVPLSTPSSISMSLDGMILNSRPRPSQTSSGQTKRSKSAAPQARIGELPISSGSSEQFSPNSVAKASRRVPFSGVPFSSPATKGQRTKPKASNQIGGGSFINGSGFNGMQQQQQQRPVMQVSVGGSRNNFLQPMNAMNAFMQQQIEAHLSQGFDEDQQQRQNSLVNVGADSNSAEIEMMKSLMAAPRFQQQQQLAQISQSEQIMNPVRGQNQNQNDDMVMSVMSSADGKERRLVMISRDTLNSLQRFAAQSQLAANMQQAGKTNQARVQQPARQQQQSRQPDNGQTSNWWPSTWASNVGQSSPTTVSPLVRESGRENEQRQQPATEQMQQEVQVQTSTLGSVGMSFGGTTSTQQPITTTQAPANELDGSTSASAQHQEGETVGNATAGDSFREVPVSAVIDSNQGGDSQQQQARGTKTGLKATSANAQTAAGGSTASAASTTTTPAEQSGGNNSNANKQQKTKMTNGKSSNGSTKRKNNGTSKSGSTSSAKQTGQTNGGSSKTSKQTTKPSSGALNGRSKSSSGGSKKTSNNQQAAGGAATAEAIGGRETSQGKKQSAAKDGSVVSQPVTNGQQRPAAMLGRANMEQLGAAPISGQQMAKVELGGRGEEPATSTASTSGGSAAQATGGEDQVGVQREPEARQTSAPRVAEAGAARAAGSTIKTGSAGRRPAAGGQQRQSAAADSARATTGNQSRLSMAASLDKKLDELEADQRDTFDQARQTGGGNRGSEVATGFEGLKAAVPGEPNVDYPIYSAPPKTSFDCAAQSCPAGYYADMETQCQVFHICQNDGRFDTFLCPNGTIFSQQHFVCVWWWQVDCQQSTTFYKLNDGIYCNALFMPAAITSGSSGQTLSGNSNQGGPSITVNQQQQRFNGTRTSPTTATATLSATNNNINNINDMRQQMPSSSLSSSSADELGLDQANLAPSSGGGATADTLTSSNPSLGSTNSSGSTKADGSASTTSSSGGQSANPADGDDQLTPVINENNNNNNIIINGQRQQQTQKQTGEGLSDEADLNQQHLELLSRGA